MVSKLFVVVFFFSETFEMSFCEHNVAGSFHKCSENDYKHEVHRYIYIFRFIVSVLLMILFIEHILLFVIADPTYMIRAIPSNASDNVYCTLLAQSALHGAMAGYSGFTVGPVNSRHAYIPISVSFTQFLLNH